MTEIELSERELEKFMVGAMSDSGFVAREILGYNYDIDRETNRRCNVGKGGIIDGEPYNTILGRMRSRERLLFMLLAPRGSMKSSCVTADCTGHFIANPDDSVLWMSGTDDQVDKWSRAVRDVFEFNSKVRLILNDGRSLKGKPWTLKKWNLACRTADAGADPSFKTGTLKKQPTGGHYHRIYVDDLIDWRNCRSPEQLALAKMVLHIIKPLRLPGSKVIMTGTRWNPGDVYSYAETLPGWDCLIMGNGYQIEEGADGLYKLTGGPNLFPQLTRDYLQEQLENMDLEDFCAQYMNMHMTGLQQAFRREWFKAVPWEPWMAGLTTWIVTDAATSTSEKACMSTGMVVGLDANRRVYLLDGFVGRVEPGQFVDELFGLHVKWSALTNLTGWTVEKVTLGQMLKSWLDVESKRRGLRLNIREIPRVGGERSKDDRIKRLQPKVRAGDFHVVDTFPQHYRDGVRNKALWHPQGYTDPNTQEAQPGGELIEQFAQFPWYPMKDMADALADIEFVYKNGEHACYYRAPDQQSTAAAARPVDYRRARGQDWLRTLGRAPR